MCDQRLVRGEVVVDWTSENDHVIQRADGSCLYHLATVVDDHDFQITHVIRSEEHLPNTPRQIFILESLGYQRPAYAHLPYVAEPGGTAKLSKRKLAKYHKNKDFANLLAHGNRIAERCGLQTEADTFNPVIVDFYREIGFCPDAILNYLLLLGWSLDGEREKFSRRRNDQTVFAGTSQSSSGFVRSSKADWRFKETRSRPCRWIDRVQPRAGRFAEKAGLLRMTTTTEQLREVVAAAADRFKIAGDILDLTIAFSKRVTLRRESISKATDQTS